MPDDPSTGEVARRLTELKEVVANVQQGVIGRYEFTVEQRRTDERIGDIDRRCGDRNGELKQDLQNLLADLREERQSRKRAAKEMREAFDGALKDLQTEFEEYKKGQEEKRRQGVYSGLLPSILGMAAIAASVIIAILGVK